MTNQAAAPYTRFATARAAIVRPSIPCIPLS